MAVFGCRTKVLTSGSSSCPFWFFSLLSKSNLIFYYLKIFTFYFLAGKASCNTGKWSHLVWCPFELQLIIADEEHVAIKRNNGLVLWLGFSVINTIFISQFVVDESYFIAWFPWFRYHYFLQFQIICTSYRTRARHWVHLGVEELFLYLWHY